VTRSCVDLIAFTGSKEVGLTMIELCGKVRGGGEVIKNVIAEMGGKKRHYCGC